MLLGDYLPSQQVSEIVQCYRIVHLKFDRSDDIPFKAYPPKPEQCLHFFLRDFFAIQKVSDAKEVQSSVVLAGQRTTLVNQYTGRDFLDVQIVFQPTAVFQLTGIPAYELANQHVDAIHILSKNLRVVLEKLQSAVDYTDLLHTIESFSKMLVCQLRKSSIPLDSVSKQMKLNNANCSIEKLAEQSCLCLKQFERQF
ncbi:MAG TPA: DUF6597 domain-containing transcriptional factor, partial [Flavisolibacter sp.]|nr:DUF6597 domain-containing transcriptional factor [Flavisolibacter sp.]